MAKIISLFSFLLLPLWAFSQAQVDLDRSVPLWMEYDSTDNQAVLKWIGDDNASSYIISEASPTFSITPIGTLDGMATEFPIGTIEKGQKYFYQIAKNTIARGIIMLGEEIPVVHERGRCLIAIDDILVDALATELDQLILDTEMDGWEVDTIHVKQSELVVSVKARITDWYEPNYEFSQSLFLLGHIPVPYSGNNAHDGHGNHQGAWAADAFYGELDGNWTDNIVNNETPSRAANKNIPGDGKYDQTVIPSNMELEVGRVDFNNLPAFAENEIELTRQYLLKNHDFKSGNKEYPRRALVENNFGSFSEGFGQTGWRNFTTMFGGGNVSTQNYEVELETNKYLFSYACGGGSYTSCAGVGTTNNLWVAKEIQTIFTINFGSYFGDWDSQNNFLRAALGSGDVLTNSWAGRPVWHFYDMSLGKHIGYCAKLTQDASGNFFYPGFSAKSAHIALMGDPTLRLHALKPAADLVLSFTDGNIVASWNPSPDASHGYLVYRKKDNSPWEFIAEVQNENTFIDNCADENTDYSYMVKAVRLERTGSGSYFNNSLGIATSIFINDNPNLITYYVDSDMDGFGDIANSTISCALPPGFVENNLDCDDSNAQINPEAIEIPNNNIDENCDGEDLMVALNELTDLIIEIFPNPTPGIIMIKGGESDQFTYRLFNAQGKVVRSGHLNNTIDISDEGNGIYWLEVQSLDTGFGYSELVLLTK